ncbi:hypothetical protein [Sphingomonas sp.]|uniref:hypothetical protein n=1 Tax=Sphingomonas sp. TaxID=28214 RepID=UPI001B191F90|nr:hypothetical protein [Sphingomonas sp.]MBO9711939.1 hypothetical protein [Sphingomonas sp.]
MIEALLLLAAGAAAPADDPYAPARAGQLQCVRPNVEKKTCAAMTRYSFGAGGKVTSVSTQMIAPQPLITMEITDDESFEGKALCSVVKAETFDNAVFKLDGNPAPADVEGAIRPQLNGFVAPLFGKKACSLLVPEGDHLLSQVTMDGAPMEQLNQPLIWVKPEDGYTLGM